MYRYELLIFTVIVIILEQGFSQTVTYTDENALAVGQLIEIAIEQFIKQIRNKFRLSIPLMDQQIALIPNQISIKLVHGRLWGLNTIHKAKDRSALQVHFGRTVEVVCNLLFRRLKLAYNFYLVQNTTNHNSSLGNSEKSLLTGQVNVTIIHVSTKVTLLFHLLQRDVELSNLSVINARKVKVTVEAGDGKKKIPKFLTTLVVKKLKTVILLHLAKLLIQILKSQINIKF